MGMALEDYLIPGEEIKFRSGTTDIRYAGSPYELLLTNKRFLLYAQRGLLLKKDDVISQKLDEVQGVKYKESGMLMKSGLLEVHGKTLMQLSGSCVQMKALYQQVMQFI